MDPCVTLPGDLLATTWQYKRDTEVIAAWLSENARKCGYQATLLTPTTTPAANDGATGGNEDAKRDTDSKTLLPSSKYPVKMSEFISMARTIAKHSPDVHVPQTIDETFNRVIMARQRCTEWFETKTPEDEDKNRRHRHFTIILERTWAALHPVETGKSEDSQVDEKKLAGRFSNLHFREDRKTRSEGGVSKTRVQSPPRSSSLPSSFKMQFNWRTTGSSSSQRQPAESSLPPWLSSKSWRSKNPG
ncbi:hypothetical protein GGS26DRAFT_589532 [Hypomontagnella submonticulosa]|nr:hypothetical protein GGS26DRAFT_589532 [Hypomontagnella submonticulosa]